MKPYNLEVKVSVEETLRRLHATLLSEPTDTIFRMSTPIVYDRIVGSITDRAFQARLYSGQVSADSVVARGQVVATDSGGARVDVDFEWGAEGPRYLVYASGVLGIVLLPLGIAHLSMSVPGALFLFYYLYQRGMATYERKCICACLSKGLQEAVHT